MWRTPRVSAGGYTRDHGIPGKERLTLEGEAQNWPTPTPQAHDAQAPKTPEQVAAARERASPRKSGGKPGFSNLNETVLNWPTPNATDGSKAPMQYARGSPSLPWAARTWPTPCERDYRTANSQESQERRNQGSARGQQLVNFVEEIMGPPSFPPSPQDPETPDGRPSSPSPRASRRRLNPDFVEWLMGWPQGWSTASIGYGPSATEFALWLQHMRFELLRLNSTPAMDADGQMLLGVA